MDLVKSKKAESKGELQLTGLPISPGLVIGRAIVSHSKEMIFSDDFITKRDVEEEFLLAKRATEKVIKELDKVRNRALEDIRPLIEAEIMILKDPTFLERVRKIIFEKKYRADFGIYSVLTDMADSIEDRGESPYMRERANELRNLAKSLVEKIQQIDKGLSKRVDSREPRVVVAEEVSIFDAFQIVRAGFKGVILGGGGKTSHTAIIFRNYRVPAVFGIGRSIEKIKNGDLIALDGGKGKVIVNPKKNTLDKFQDRLKAYIHFTEELMRLKDVTPRTKDGREIVLMANIDFEEEVEFVQKYGSYGIGLFRTEILYLTNRIDEEIQTTIYRDIAEKVYPKKVIFRAFDIGGDKVLRIREGNPFLGLRGIRVLLKEKELFKAQIRAILKANKKGNIAFMIPMVSTVNEIKETIKLINEVKKSINGGDTLPNLEFGIMVETPSAALMIKEFAPYIDFISVGTNDLTQYTLAVDRRNPRVSYLYDHLHPAVLKLTAKAVRDAKGAGLKVSICGELASDPMGIPLLIGMGVDELSVTPVVLLETKELIMGISQDEATELLEKALRLPTTRDVRKLTSRFLNKRFPNLVMFYPI